MKTFTFDSAIVGPWVCEKAGGMYHPKNPAIGLLDNGVLKVGVYYDGFTGTSIAMHSRCDDPKTPNREFYRIIFDYPFNQLKVKVVRALVSTNNQKARRIDEKLGWKYETTLVDYFPDGDGIVYVMRKAECRWIRKYHERTLEKAA